MAHSIQIVSSCLHPRGDSALLLTELWPLFIIIVHEQILETVNEGGMFSDKNMGR